MSETRIRWEPTAGGVVYGYAGTRGTAVFKIWQPSDGTTQPWALKSDWVAGYFTGTHPDDLKAEAERWLADYVSSLGASFEDPAEVAALRKRLAAVESRLAKTSGEVAW